MIKSKKCKGQGKAISFNGCGKMTDVKFRRYGLCTSCFADFILNTDYGKILLEKATLKATKDRRELEKAEKEKTENDKLSYHLKKTQTLVNKAVRLRDKHKPCISQNIPWQKDFDAGHCYSVKQYSALRFDFDNIHSQSIYANRFKEGDEQNYLMNLPNRIGKERTEALIKRAELSKVYTKKWTRTELVAIQNEAKELIKKYENE